MKKILCDAVVFDQGNTIVMDPFKNALSKAKKKLERIMRRAGVKMSAQRIEREWTRSNSAIDFPFSGHFVQEEIFVQDFMRRAGISSEKIAVLAPLLLSEYRKNYINEVRVQINKRKIKKFLIELKSKGKKIGIFSNDKSIGLNSALESCGIKKYFDYIETSEEFRREKPDPAVFRRIEKKMGVARKKIVYVGDDPKRDIIPAKRFGMSAVLYLVSDSYHEKWRNYAYKKNCSPDAEVRNLQQLLSIIE
ncbi:MAG: HAD family hydrolase [Candidatus Woesearchaeota archaeon]|nr:HAD family hydrolase [Candidatus Woesearchaeota archaeon]